MGVLIWGVVAVKLVVLMLVLRMIANWHDGHHARKEQKKFEQRFFQQEYDRARTAEVKRQLRQEERERARAQQATHNAPLTRSIESTQPGFAGFGDFDNTDGLPEWKYWLENLHNDTDPDSKGS